MLKARSLMLICVSFLCFPFLAQALVINEIMYDAPGADTAEWVELYNDTASPVNIITGAAKGSWRIVDNSPHVLKIALGTSTIPVGGYAVVTKNLALFQSVNPGARGTIFTGALSLGNTGGVVSLKDANGIIESSVPYQVGSGAGGDGNSLQWVAGVWQPGRPTPGGVNTSVKITPTTKIVTKGKYMNGGSTQIAAAKAADPAPEKITIQKPRGFWSWIKSLLF